MWYRAQDPQVQQYQNPSMFKIEHAYQEPNYQSTIHPKSCDEFTYNWLHNEETKHGLTTPRCSSQTINWTEQHQNPVALDTTTPYVCKFLAQLQGKYEVDATDGVEIINVFLVEPQIGQQQYATVRWIQRSREIFPDKYIFEDFTQFNLRSKNGVTEAVMAKGMNMKFSVDWIMTDGSKWTWRRASDVEFDIVSVNSLVDPNSRRGSVNSVVSSVGTSIFGMNSIQAMGYNGDIGLEHIRPEPLSQNYAPTYKVTLDDTEKDFSKLPLDTTRISDDCGVKRIKLTFSDPITITIHSESSFNFQCPSCNVVKNKKDYLEDLKKLCSENLSVKNCILKCDDNEMRMEQSEEDYHNLSHGRVWVTARLDAKIKDGAWQAAVNELKGAYQETENESEIYVQSAQPQGNLKRHRLRRNSMNLWVVELQKEECEQNWSLCVEQLAGEQWIDHRYGRKSIVVHVVPLSSMLERIGEQRPETLNLQKVLQFIFTSCNRKKLSSNLKMRNIKHNIANLKAKLDKQRSLAFAIQLSNTAEKISAEL